MVQSPHSSFYSDVENSQYISHVDSTSTHYTDIRGDAQKSHCETVSSRYTDPKEDYRHRHVQSHKPFDCETKNGPVDIPLVVLPNTSSSVKHDESGKARKGRHSKGKAEKSCCHNRQQKLHDLKDVTGDDNKVSNAPTADVSVNQTPSTMHTKSGNIAVVDAAHQQQMIHGKGDNSSNIYGTSFTHPTADTKASRSSHISTRSDVTGVHQLISNFTIAPKPTGLRSNMRAVTGVPMPCQSGMYRVTSVVPSGTFDDTFKVTSTTVPRPGGNRRRLTTVKAECKGRSSSVSVIPVEVMIAKGSKFLSGTPKPEPAVFGKPKTYPSGKFGPTHPVYYLTPDGRVERVVYHNQNRKQLSDTHEEHAGAQEPRADASADRDSKLHETIASRQTIGSSARVNYDLNNGVSTESALHTGVSKKSANSMLHAENRNMPKASMLTTRAMARGEAEPSTDVYRESFVPLVHDQDMRVFSRNKPNSKPTLKPSRSSNDKFAHNLTQSLESIVPERQLRKSSDNIRVSSSWAGSPTKVTDEGCTSRYISHKNIDSTTQLQRLSDTDCFTPQVEEAVHPPSLADTWASRQSSYHNKIDRSLSEKSMIPLQIETIDHDFGNKELGCDINVDNEEIQRIYSGVSKESNRQGHQSNDTLPGNFLTAQDSLYMSRLKRADFTGTNSFTQPKAKQDRHIHFKSIDVESISNHTADTTSTQRCECICEPDGEADVALVRNSEIDVQGSGHFIKRQPSTGTDNPYNGYNNIAEDNRVHRESAGLDKMNEENHPQFYTERRRWQTPKIVHVVDGYVSNVPRAKVTEKEKEHDNIHRYVSNVDRDSISKTDTLHMSNQSFPKQIKDTVHRYHSFEDAGRELLHKSNKLTIASNPNLDASHESVHTTARDTSHKSIRPDTSQRDHRESLVAPRQVDDIYRDSTHQSIPSKSSLPQQKSYVRQSNRPNPARTDHSKTMYVDQQVNNKLRQSDRQSIPNQAESALYKDTSYDDNRDSFQRPSKQHEPYSTSHRNLLIETNRTDSEPIRSSMRLDYRASELSNSSNIPDQVVSDVSIVPHQSGDLKYVLSQSLHKSATGDKVISRDSKADALQKRKSQASGKDTTVSPSYEAHKMFNEVSKALKSIQDKEKSKSCMSYKLEGARGAKSQNRKQSEKFTPNTSNPSRTLDTSCEKSSRQTTRKSNTFQQDSREYKGLESRHHSLRYSRTPKNVSTVSPSTFNRLEELNRQNSKLEDDSDNHDDTACILETNYSHCDKVDRKGTTEIHQLQTDNINEDGIITSPPKRTKAEINENEFETPPDYNHEVSKNVQKRPPTPFHDNVNRHKTFAKTDVEVHCITSAEIAQSIDHALFGTLERVQPPELAKNHPNPSNEIQPDTLKKTHTEYPEYISLDKLGDLHQYDNSIHSLPENKSKTCQKSRTHRSGVLKPSHRARPCLSEIFEGETMKGRRSEDGASVFENASSGDDDEDDDDEYDETDVDDDDSDVDGDGEKVLPMRAEESSPELMGKRSSPARQASGVSTKPPKSEKNEQNVDNTKLTEPTDSFHKPRRNQTQESRITSIKKSSNKPAVDRPHRQAPAYSPYSRKAHGEGKASTSGGKAKSTASHGSVSDHSENKKSGKAKKSKSKLEESNPDLDQSLETSGKKKKSKHKAEESNPDLDQSLETGGKKKKSKHKAEESNPDLDQSLETGGKKSPVPSQSGSFNRLSADTSKAKNNKSLQPSPNPSTPNLGGSQAGRGKGKSPNQGQAPNKGGMASSHSLGGGGGSKPGRPSRGDDSGGLGEDSNEQTPPGVVIFQIAARYATFGGLRVAGGVRVIMDAPNSKGYVQIISPLAQPFITHHAGSMNFLHSSSAAGVAWSAVIWDPPNSENGGNEHPGRVDSAQVIFCEPYQAHRFRAVLETLKAAFSPGDGGVITPNVPPVPQSSCYDPCNPCNPCYNPCAPPNPCMPCPCPEPCIQQIPSNPCAQNPTYDPCRMSNNGGCGGNPSMYSGPPNCGTPCPPPLPFPPPRPDCLPPSGCPPPCPPSCCPTPPPPFCSNMGAGANNSMCPPTPCPLPCPTPCSGQRLDPCMNLCPDESDPYAYTNAYGKTLFCQVACLVKLGRDEVWQEMNRGPLMVVQEPNCMGYSLVLVNEKQVVLVIQKLSRKIDFKPSPHTQHGFIYTAITTTDKGSLHENFLVCFLCKSHADQFHCVVTNCKRIMMMTSANDCNGNASNNNNLYQDDPPRKRASIQFVTGNDMMFPDVNGANTNASVVEGIRCSMNGHVSGCGVMRKMMSDRVKGNAIKKTNVGNSDYDKMYMQPPCSGAHGQYNRDDVIRCVSDYYDVCGNFMSVAEAERFAADGTQESNTTTRSSMVILPSRNYRRDDVT